MAAPPPDADLRTALDGLILRRLRIGLGAIGASAIFFLVQDRLWIGTWSGAVAGVSGLVLVALALFALRLPVVAARPRQFALLVFAVFCIRRTALGIALNELELTAILLVLVAVCAGAILPWGVGAQCAAVLMSGGGAVLAEVALAGRLDSFAEEATALVSLASSILFAFELQRTHRQAFTENLRRARAERELAALNSDLEARIRARGAELAAAAAARRNDLARFADILEHAPAAIYVKDLAGRYLLINQRAAAALGRARGDVIGHTPDELLGAEVGQALRANDREVLASGTPLQFEEVLRDPDGPRTFLSVKFALHRADGTPSAVCGISTEITDRKRIEAELRRSQAALLAVIENTDDAIWSVDRDGRVTVHNSAARRRLAQHFATLSAADAIEEHLPAEIRTALRGLYRAAFAGERTERELRVGDGPAGRIYLLSAHPIVDGAEITGATVFARDITDYKRAEEQARAHQADLAHVLRLGTMGEMAAGLAHEINQPLGAIANYARGGVRRLQGGNTTPDALLPILEAIADEALRAGAVIRRMRELVRKEHTPHRPVDLNQLVRDSARLVEPHAREDAVAISLALADPLPPVIGDAIQIEQVLLNLLLNAIDAVRPMPAAARRVRVRTTHQPGEQVEVEVRDTGNGLPSPPADVFAPFFTTKPHGLGMGLSISRSIAEAHGGTLTAADAGDRAGSVFRLVLPVSGPPAEPAHTIDPAAIGGEPHGG